jgi:hypothetical protein
VKKIQNHCTLLYSAAFERPRGFVASCERFSPAGSRQLEIDGATRLASFNFSYFFSQTIIECSQLCYTGEKL